MTDPDAAALIRELAKDLEFAIDVTLPRETLLKRFENTIKASALFAPLTARETALPPDEMRRIMWLNHGCIGLYGDDGEMQCNASHQNEDAKAIGPLDFKRDDLHRLQAAMLSLLRYNKRRAEQAEATVAALEAALATAQQEAEKFRTAARVLCGAHIGVPQSACPVCERDTLRDQVAQLQQQKREKR